MLSSNLVRVVIDGGTLHGANIEGSIDRPRKRARRGGNRPTSCPWRHRRTIACCHRVATLLVKELMGRENGKGREEVGKEEGGERWERRMGMNQASYSCQSRRPTGGSLPLVFLT